MLVAVVQVILRTVIAHHEWQRRTPFKRVSLRTQHPTNLAPPVLEWV